MDKTRKTMLLSIFAFIVFGSIVYVAVYGYLITGNKVQTDSQFCTDKDDVYQAITINLDIWFDYFPSRYSVSTPKDKQLLKFSTSQNKPYVVQSDLWEYTETSRVYLVKLVSGGPSTPREGVRGYIYSQNGQLPPLPQRYNSMNIDNYIFCYWLEGTEPNPTTTRK